MPDSGKAAFPVEALSEATKVVWWPRFAGNSYLLGYLLLSNGDIAEWVRLEGDVSELFDVAIIPGVRWPIASGFLNDEVHRLYTFET